MARRVIAIPLAVAIAIAVFSSFCFATSLPSNNVDGILQIICQAETASYWTFPAQTYSFGTLNGFFYRTPSDTPISFGFSFSITLNGDSTIYIAVKQSLYDSDVFNYGDLDLYRSRESDFDYTLSPYTFSYYTYRPVLGGNNTYSLDSNTTTGNLPCTFVCFEDVPAGTYLVLDSNISIVGTTYTSYVAGVFVSNKPDPSSVIDNYLNGNTSFSDSVIQIGNIVNSNIAAAENDTQKLFEAVRGSFELDRLVNLSNDRSITDVKENITPVFENQITSYVSGSSSLDDTIAAMSSTYTEALGAADTPEQGILVNTTYEIKMQQLEFEARQKANAKMDSAITDEDLQKADDFYQLEDDIFALFDLQELKDNLVFDQWYQSMSLTQAVSYKTIFDWFLNDSEVRYWLIVPISFIVIAILLSTTYKVTGKWDD